MVATAIIVPTQLVYMSIPHKVLRESVDGFVDRLIPGLSNNPFADSVRGYGHRYRAGHDILFDVPRTMVNHGPMNGLRHAGHILATDFPTKAGIPIPGFSQSGFGPLLEQAGIHRGWMQLNFCDAGLGFYVIAEGSTDLAQALQGTLTMDWGTFFDTFVEGSLEISCAMATQNSLFILGAAENIFAGLISSWNTLSVYINPLDFFGSMGTSALIGFCLAYNLAGENLSDAGKDAIRSGTIGALFTLSSAFGFGALAGFTAYRLGEMLSKNHNKLMSSSLSIDEKAYRLLVEEICKGNIPVRELLECSKPRLILNDDAQILTKPGHSLNDRIRAISTDCLTLASDVQTLRVNAPILSKKIKTLLNDPPMLADWYQYTA